MLDFQVQRCTRKCAATERDLKPGESFFSMLVVEGAEVVRRDFSAEAWEGPSEDALGWWKSQMPHPHARKLHWAPNDVMLDYLEQLEHEPEQQDIRYVLALLLLRRRVLRLEETDRNGQGGERMALSCSRNDASYQVAVVEPTAARLEEIRGQLAQLLFAEAA